SRRERGHGLDPCQVLRIGTDVRLHFDRADQRSVRRIVSRRLTQRTPPLHPLEHRPPDERDSCSFCCCGHALFLVGKRQRHPRVERKGPTHHVHRHGDGSHHGGLVYLHDGNTWRAPSTLAFPQEHCLRQRLTGLAQAHFVAIHRRPDRHFHRPWSLGPCDE